MAFNTHKLVAIKNEDSKSELFETSTDVLELCKDITLSSPDLIAVIDYKYHYININENYKQLVGKKYESFIGRCIANTFGESQYEQIIKPKLNNCVHKKEKTKMCLEIIDNQNNKLFLEAICKPDIDNNKNKQKRIYMYFRDITDFKNKIENLERQKNLLHAVIDKVPNLISIRDIDGKFIMVNSATANVYGQKPIDLIGKSDKELNHQPWKTESCIEIDTQVMEKRQERMILEETVTDKNGKPVWLQTTKQPFVDSSTDEVYVLGVSTIITQHRIAKEKLKQSEKRFKDFAETAANIFWELDKELNYSYLSGNIQNLVSNSSVYPLGKKYDSLFINNPKCEFDIESYKFMLDTRADILNYTFSVQSNENEIDIFRINAKPIFNEDKDFEGYRGIIRNITEERALLERIAYDAKHDALTGLVNRNEFDKHLKTVIKKSKKLNEESILCYLDLDHFKVVNDAAGHRAGDQLLKRLGDLLKDSVRSSDIVARLGGDEFGIILERCPLNNAMKICENILSSINQFVLEWDKHSFKVGVSIGIAMITNKTENDTLVMSQADMACYRAKELGRNQMHVAHTDDTAILERSSEFTYVSAITDALNNDRLFLMKQPIISLREENKVIPHYEILSRILDVKDNIIPPNDFIRVAERYGMITGIDRYVVKKAFQYHIQQHSNTDVVISINLSGYTVCDPYILDFIKQELEKTRIKPHCVCFEITETAAISSITKARNVINELKTIGVKFALDDFGSGLSSFGYLKDLPVDYIKIDGSFVKNIVNNSKDRAIVRSINEVAKIMEMQTIAECVENSEILNNLCEIGVDYAQGYGIGKPEKIH